MILNQEGRFTWMENHGTSPVDTVITTRSSHVAMHRGISYLLRLVASSKYRTGGCHGSDWMWRTARCSESRCEGRCNVVSQHKCPGWCCGCSCSVVVVMCVTDQPASQPAARGISMLPVRHAILRIQYLVIIVQIAVRSLSDSILLCACMRY